MGISIPATGGSSVQATGTTVGLSISTSVPSGAIAGDVLFVVASAERSEVPTLTIAGSSSGYSTIRSESSTNLSTLIVWKRLTSSDLGQTITLSNTAQRRQAIAAIIVRGALDPVSTNQAFSAASGTIKSKTGPQPTPTADNSLAVSLWGIVPNNGQYTGYNFSSTYTERGEADAVYPSALNPTSFISAALFGTGTAGAAQVADTVSNPIGKFDSMATISVLAPATNLPPVVSAGADTTVPVSTPVTLTGTATDSDGTIASRAWTWVTTGTLPSLSGASTNTVTFTAPSTPGSYVLQFAATDDDGATTTDQVTVTVVAAGAPTVLVNQTIGNGLIDARASTPGAGGNLTFTISPTATQITPGVWYAAPGAAAATYTVTATEDSSGTSASAPAVVQAAAGAGGYTGAPISLTLPTPGDPSTAGHWGDDEVVALNTLQDRVNDLSAFLAL